MAILASDIIERVQRLVQDETSVRWPLSELCNWLNDACREVVLQKPSASSSSRVIALQAGTWQQLPGDVIQLLRIVRNITAVSGEARTGGAAIRIVSRDILDTQHRDWHSGDEVRFAATVKHYVYDEEDQKSFYVYPGNDGTGKVEAVLCVTPATIAVAEDADPEALESYAVDLPLNDIYASALIDFVCYRAYSKDAQYVGNTNRAALHYQQFANSIGIKFKLEISSSPNSGEGIKLTPAGTP